MTIAVDLKAEETTLVTLTNPFPFKGARDAMVNYGAAAGAGTAWDRLAEPPARA